MVYSADLFRIWEKGCWDNKGEYEEITKIEKIQEEVEVYNLRVTSSAMNYFADSYLVHNASLCDECAAKNNKL